MALSRSKAALNAEKTPPLGEDVPVVNMANRGLPLINLLIAAAEADCNVMWE